MVRYPALALNFTRTHLCDTPFCNVSRDNCAIPTETSTKEFCDTIATSIARYEKDRCWASKLAPQNMRFLLPSPRLSKLKSRPQHAHNLEGIEHLIQGKKMNKIIGPKSVYLPSFLEGGPGTELEPETGTIGTFCRKKLKSLRNRNRRNRFAGTETGTGSVPVS